MPTVWALAKVGVSLDRSVVYDYAFFYLSPARRREEVVSPHYGKRFRVRASELDQRLPSFRVRLNAPDFDATSIQF